MDMQATMLTMAMGAGAGAIAASMIHIEYMAMPFMIMGGAAGFFLGSGMGGAMNPMEWF